jgi:hypothetical protein
MINEGINEKWEELLSNDQQTLHVTEPVKCDKGINKENKEFP